MFAVSFINTFSIIFDMKPQKPHKYLTPLLIFLLLFSISLSYTYITPSLIKVAKIISSENSQYFLDFTNDPALKVLGSIITEKDVNTTSGRFCIGNDCISSWNSLSGIPSGYCVLFYNATCPSGFVINDTIEIRDYSLGFDYKREVNITDTSGTTLTDYQVKITLDTQSLISQGKMKSNCADIRFYYTNSSGTYEIPYWIEDGTCNTPNTNIWVKIPEIPANGQTTVYMYYGNPSATSESNATLVWDFYLLNGLDEHPYVSANLGGWDRYTTTLPNGLSGQVLRFWESSRGEVKIKFTDKQISQNGIFIFTYIQHTSDDAGDIEVGGTTQTSLDASGYYKFYSNPGAGYNSQFCSRYTPSTTNLGSCVSNSLTYGTWYREGVVIYPNGNSIFYYSNNGAIEKNPSSKITSITINRDLQSDFPNWYPLLGGWIYNGYVYVYSYIIGKYVDPEPSVSIGEEQKYINTKQIIVCCKE